VKKIKASGNETVASLDVADPALAGQALLARLGQEGFIEELMLLLVRPRSWRKQTPVQAARALRACGEHDELVQNLVAMHQEIELADDGNDDVDPVDPGALRRGIADIGAWLCQNGDGDDLKALQKAIADDEVVSATPQLELIVKALTARGVT
jgi:hypothetical protein